MKVSCPICGSDGKLLVRVRDRMFISNKTFSIFKCSYCETLFIFPPPSNEELLKYYEKLTDSYYSFRILNTQRTSIIEEFFKTIAHSKAIPRGNSIEGLKGERLLDIGCGMGEFLVKTCPFFKEVYGVDVSSYAVRMCRKRGLKVYKGSYEHVEFPKEFFDVITMFHVLEHVQDPISFLRKAYRELKPRGTIVVGVPDAGGFPAKFFRRNWRALDPPRHLFCFSENALKFLLNRSGSRVVHIKKIPGGGENIRSVFISVSKKDPDIDASKIFRFLALINDIIMSPFSNFGMNNSIEVRATKD